MIRKNGNNKYVIDYGAVLQVIVIVGVILSVFYHRIGQIDIMIMRNTVKLEGFERRIIDNRNYIVKIADEFHKHEVGDK